MLLSVVSPGRWKPERRAKEREEGRDHTPRASQAYPNGAGNVPPGQVESGLTMSSHEGRAKVTWERKNPKDLNARAFSGN